MILFLNGGCISAADEEICLENIRTYAEKEEVIAVKIEEEMNWNRVHRHLEDAHAIVLAAGVYLDSVSPRVLSFLQKVEQAVIEGESIGAKFYAILYTDLYEGEQTGIAMAVLKNFCERANIVWGRGLGIGGNHVKAAMRTKKPWRIFRKDRTDFRLNFLREHALFIREKIQGTDVYINPKEVSRGRYIRQLNHEIKKINRVKIAQN